QHVDSPLYQQHGVGHLISLIPTSFHYPHACPVRVTCEMDINALKYCIKNGASHIRYNSCSKQCNVDPHGMSPLELFVTQMLRYLVVGAGTRGYIDQG